MRILIDMHMLHEQTSLHTDSWYRFLRHKDAELHQEVDTDRWIFISYILQKPLTFSIMTDIAQ